MTNNSLLNQIGNLIEEKLEPVKKQLGSVENKIDRLEIKIEMVNKRVEETKKELEKAIKDSQEDTIQALSELVETGYALHEKRIKRVEENLHLPPVQ